MTEKSLENFSAPKAFFRSILLPLTTGSVWKLIFTVLKDFFFLQLNQKFHFTKRPILNVDTEIDKKIPFKPEHVKTYLSFIDFFIRLAKLKLIGRGFSVY